MSTPIRELVIAGRDAPLWLAANVMHFALAPAGVTVTVVELPSRVQPADVYASLPALEPLHSRLRIEESRLLRETRGTFSLGRRFVDIAGDTAAFFHAHGSNGSRVDRQEFLPHWLRARALGMSSRFEDFSLTAAAARQGRMLLPDAEIDAFGFTDYGYHLPAIPYGAWLRQLALRRGVRSHRTRGMEVLRGPTGIDALLLDEGRRIGGEFFLDVTGSEATLITALEVGQESWRQRFVADRLLSGCAELKPPIPVYTEVRAQQSGWASLSASQVCVHVQQAWCSELLSEESLQRACADMALQAVLIRERHPARRCSAWEKNCVALGEAACVFDPLHSLELQALQTGLVHLLTLFPVQPDFGAERVEYNQNLRSAFERMRDFQSAHYALSRYRPEFWARSRAAPISAELAHKIDAFRARGEPVHYEDEAFTIDDWQALFIGHGVVPETWDPAADRTPPEFLASELRRILTFIQRKVDTQPTHADYLHSFRTASQGQH